MLVWFQSSAMVWMRSSVFWNVTRHWLVSYHCLGTIVGPVSKGQAAWPLKMEPVGCPKMLVANYSAVKHPRRAHLRLIDGKDNLSVPLLKSWAAWPWKMMSISCPKMSAANCCGASQKSKDIRFVLDLECYIFLLASKLLGITCFHIFVLGTVFVAVHVELNQPPALN
jgi:hypothetical protein